MQKSRPENLSSFYLVQLFSELQNELNGLLEPSQQASMEKLWSLIEHDYMKYGLVGKGYHCLEHSLELAVLLLKSLKQKHDGLPELDPEELVELAVTAILHDYDPHSNGDVPRVERTLHVLRTDEVLQGLLKDMSIDVRKVSLLIERTDYPFTPEMEKSWKRKMADFFTSERERQRYTAKGELVALFDKACTYYSLDPQKVKGRIAGLADEQGRPVQDILRLTSEFLVREKVGKVADWAPKEYRARWKDVEKYFMKLAGRKNAPTNGGNHSALM